MGGTVTDDDPTRPKAVWCDLSRYQQTNGQQEVIWGGNTQISVTDVPQTVKIKSQTRVAIIEQQSNDLSWKTIWNYNTGVIATKVMQENTCYISTMNRTEMPSFENLPRLARESRNQLGLGRFTRKITFVTGGLVSNLNSYGADIINMCSGAITYQAYEVHGPQVNVGPCVTLNVLRVVELKYCNSNGFPNQPQQDDQNQQVIIGGQSQIVTIHSQWRVAVIQQTTSTGSWKTIWNYNTGVIATKVMQENTCYISTMNRTEMPSFENLPRLARESRNQLGLGRFTRKITFVTGGLVSNLNSYGADIINMCSGAITYQAYEVHAFTRPQVNLGTCFTLDVLRVVELKYCNSNGFPNQPQQDDQNQQVIIGGQSQIVTIHSQWRVAVIQQTTSTGSWKTIWNYNTGVIATKVMQENTCYISTMNRTEMPSFENLPRLARESRNQLGLGRFTRKITFVTGGLVSNLNSYGADIINMCSGAITYQAYEVHAFTRPQVNLGLCVTLDVLRVVELKYCNSSGFPNQPQQPDYQNPEVIIGGQSQIVTIHSQWRVAVIQQTTSTGSWKTIWNYNTGVIATKVMQENTCYISTMNRTEMPSFENLPRLARESRNQLGLGRFTRKITFVTGGLVSNLNSYGADIINMCSGAITYQAYEVHAFTRPQVNLGTCFTLDVLRVVELKYCNSSGFPNQPQQDDQNPEVIIGGQSQIVTIHSQWRVAVIQQTTSTGSWKTIWNYNTGVIATKVMQENTCYISTMNRTEMPSFENLPRLARESRNQLGLGRFTRKITFVTGGLVSNLNSYGADIINMCSGAITYQAYEVHAFTRPQVNLGLCVTLDVLRVVELKYCNSNGFPNQPQQDDQNQQVIIGGQSQIVTIHSQWRVAVIQQTTSTGSWKTIWNYNTGVIATKVMQENTCYISTMNRTEMPSFENLPRLARESRNQLGLGRFTRKITFVTGGLVSNLNSYGADIINMCSGAITYQAYEVHAFTRPQVNLGTCFTLDVLRVVELKYCNSNGFPNQPQQDDQNQQVIIGGQSQIVTIHSQWRVAVIQQTTSTGSWKTIWNYNTGVIATKVMQENTCYISTMNRTEMPSFENLPRLARESRNQLGLGRFTRKITFVTGGLVSNLNSYGADIINMCSGAITYQAYEVHAFTRPQVNLGTCFTLDVLRVVELKYCNSNGFPNQPQQDDQNQQVIIGGQSQIVTIHSQWRVAVIQQTTSTGSWKTIWNYNTGVIATKVMQENTCYISTMNRTEMPSFENLPRLARESRNQLGLGRFTRKITFVTGGLVSNLNSYGADIINMCSGAITYQAYEVHAFTRPQVNLGTCFTLDVLRVVELKYCNSNGFPNQPQQDDQNQQVIIGGQSQIVTIHSQWRVAVIQQTTSTGSWKTIWNYNTGVIATKVMQENTCYISTMNRTEMPSFENLPRLARESRNQLGLGRFTRKITFVTGGLVSNLNSYGADIINMCSGAITYQAYEVHAFTRPQVNLGLCVTLDVLRVVELKYCNSSGFPNQV
ncbi:uncharacterized protein [Pithys albifrons albifrons]|uniref:uncharacterized protein n=1 Tax=Pithys albifrons albifrons TaxID=3385563 RepID=UPI003A5CE0A9